MPNVPAVSMCYKVVFPEGVSLVIAVGSEVEVSRARGLFCISDVAIGSNTDCSRIDRERLVESRTVRFKMMIQT